MILCPAMAWNPSETAATNLHVDVEAFSAAHGLEIETGE